MRRFMLIGTILIVVGLVLALTSQSTQALPEYSAQTGEPCASCHVSPSGGGIRTPGGQAWVGLGRPGYVPELTEALEELGVRLEVDPEAYVAVPASIPPAEPLPIKPEQNAELHDWLKDYPGN